MDYDVVCVGQTCADILIRGLDLSVSFDSERKSVEQLDVGAGGDATNQSIVMSRLGLKTKLISGLGNDNFGKLLKGIIKDAGADTSGIVISDTLPTSRVVVVVAPDGQRNFIHTSGVSAGQYVPDAKAVAGAKVVSIASLLIPPFKTPDLLIPVVSAAKENGSIICADTVYNNDSLPFKEFSPILPSIDYFFPNDYEAGMITGESDEDKMADAFLKLGIKNVIIKIGKRGSFFKNAKESFIMPTFDSSVVDTTGAGDNFASGFIAALLEGHDHAYCCKFGNAVASVSIQSLGANTGVRDRRQVMDFMATHKQYSI